jgi:hypothetical protein
VETEEMKAVKKGKPVSSSVVRVIHKTKVETIPVSPITLPVEDIRQDDQLAAIVHAALVSVRDEIAIRLKVPPYSVLSTADLQATAQARPLAVNQLAGRRYYDL